MLEIWKSREMLSCTAQSPNLRLSGSVTVTQGRTALSEISTAPSAVSSSMHSSHASYREDTFRTHCNGARASIVRYGCCFTCFIIFIKMCSLLLCLQYLLPGFEDYRKCVAHSCTQYNGPRVYRTVKLVSFDSTAQMPK